MFFSMTSGGLAVVALGVFVACVVSHAPFHPFLLKHHGSSGTIFAPLLRVRTPAFAQRSFGRFGV